ncbi:MAG: pilus (MSHA type) biogenesis protein MshL [Gammaproteobacteria bacterium]
MKTRLLNALIITGAMVWLSACQTQATRDEIVNDADRVLREAADTNTEKAGVPDNVSSALIPSINLGSTDMPGLAEDDQRFDISVNNVPADQFFLSLVDGTAYNMVVHPEVGGSITLNLRDVTIPEVMEAVRDVYGYEFVNTTYGFQVLPGRLRARIYQINYLNVERSGSSQTFVSSGSLTQSTSQDDTGSDIDAGTRRSPSRSSLTGTQISTRQPESVFWAELRSSVQAIVGSGEGRSVVVNPQSGVVVVRALPNELREVESFLTATQLVVQRQVILEAKIIEVTLSDSFQSGINWSGLITRNNNSLTVGNTGGGTILQNESGRSEIGGNTGILDPSQYDPIEGTAASAFGGVFTMALNLGDFTSFIELLETQGNVRVLSSPRVATINNQKAVIKVGTDEFFVTDITNTTVTGTTTTVTPSVTLTPFFSGIALDVTPQISQDGVVTLHVHPSVSDVVDQQKSVTIGTLTQQLPLALSTIRESDSIVRARSGQVIVIGGLMQDSSTNRAASAPGLGDIPLLGNLFRHRNDVSVKSELVILLKPIVVDDTDQWTDAINEYSQGLDGLRESRGVR